MNERDDESVLAEAWRSGVLLERDIFSTIERGHSRAEAGEVEAVLRRLDEVPWWCRALAHFLFRRERRALAIAGPLGICPPILFAGRRMLVRGWIDGVSPSRTVISAISAPPRRRCGHSITPALPTMIPPRNRIGSM